MGKDKNEVKIRRGGLGAVWISASPPSCNVPFCVTDRAARQTCRPHSRFYLDKATCFDNLNNTLRATDPCHVIRKEPHNQMINEHLAKYSYDPNEVTRWEALNLTSCYGVFPGEHVSVTRGVWPRHNTTFCGEQAVFLTRYCHPVMPCALPAVCIYVYIGFKTSFYIVRHLASTASYLPTGLHLGLFRSWPYLYLPSSLSSVFLAPYRLLLLKK